MFDKANRSDNGIDHRWRTELLGVSRQSSREEATAFVGAIAGGIGASHREYFHFAPVTKVDFCSQGLKADPTISSHHSVLENSTSPLAAATMSFAKWETLGCP